jgi:hypothetical protein
VFTVDCGTNGNRKFSPDNPVAQPGVKNGAQHVHDFVGNLSISADSTDESLEASDTTCVNGDRGLAGQQDPGRPKLVFEHSRWLAFTTAVTEAIA